MPTAVKTIAYVTVDHLFSRFTSRNKLKITVGWLLHYRDNLQKHRTERAKHKSIESSPVEGLLEAELQIIFNESICRLAARVDVW